MSVLLRSLTGTLPDQEVEVLTDRFGLDGAESETLEEIGHQFGVTRERIRQLQNAASQASPHDRRVGKNPALVSTPLGQAGRLPNGFDQRHA